MKCQVLALVSLVIMVLMAAVSTYAMPTEKYDALKARYQTLRNTDPGIERKADWYKLVTDFAAVADSDPPHKYSSAALYHVGLLQEQLFVVLGDAQAGESAIRSFERFVEKYSGEGVADDALLRIEQIQLSSGDEDAARDTFVRLRKDYPRSELVAVGASLLENDDDAISESQEETPAKLTGKQPIIVIDPGHGGEDFGALGQGGLLEKDVTLAVAFELASILKREHGAIVRLTRERDIFVPLADRTIFANDSNADVFVSLHTNASAEGSRGKLFGIESYFLDNAKDAASKLLAERENASGQHEGGQSDLQFMLSDLMQSSKLGESKELAETIQQSVIKRVSLDFDKPKDLGVKKGPFYVLVGAHMPSVLIEMAFIDNAIEGKNLAQKKFRQAMAQGIAAGISRYFTAVHKRGTR